MFLIFNPREEMTKLVALVIIVGCLKLTVEYLAGYLWQISVNVMTNALKFKSCFALYKNFEIWKIFIKQKFKAFKSLINVSNG